MLDGKEYNLAVSAKGGMIMGLYRCPSDIYSDICTEITSSISWYHCLIGPEGDSMRGYRETSWKST